MMNSSFDDDDNDGFGANPFRTASASGSTGTSSTTSDLLGTPNPMQQQNHQQHQHQQQQQYNLPNPTAADPVSGFSGQLDLPPPMQQQQFQQQQMQQQQQQTQYNNLSGAMDNSRSPSQQTSGGAGAYGSNGTTDPNSTAANRSMLSMIPTWGSCMACLRLDSYTQYFNVDTVDVQYRLKAAVTIFWQPDQFRTAVLGEPAVAGAQDQDNDDNNNNSNNNNNNNGANFKGPDLYGPVWISLTLIFMIAVTSNLSAYMHHRVHTHQASAAETQVQAFEYDLHHLVRALTVVGTFSLGVPTFFWLAATCVGMPGVSLALWMCMYGYSLVPFLAAVWLAWVPWEIVSWVVLGGATAASALLVVRNLSTPLMQQDSATHTRAAPLIMGILGAHTFFLFVLKFTFFP